MDNDYLLDTKVIILAAGKGKRMLPLTNKIPKCILPINNTTILERLIGQITNGGIYDITVVVGYKKDTIMDIVNNKYKKIKFIINKKYEQDVNILSLTLALQKEIKPFYLFEADCIFEERCLDIIFNPKHKNESIWFSKGYFNQKQNGGIIKANKNNEVIDIQIVDKYNEKYKEYKKMIGVLKVGDNEIERSSHYLFKACEKSINQYYHIPWIKHINELKSYLCDFNDLKVASINTIEDYHKAQEMFKYEVS